MNIANILVVEDEGIIALAIKKSLEKIGHRIVGIVASADEAIRQAKENKPDLILMDIRIRGPHDGIFAAMKIREILDVPIIYMSGFSDEATMERAWETKPRAFLHKPVNIPQLQEIILDIQDT